MNRIKTFIIDDEEPARALIRKFLEGFDEIEIAGEYADGFSGIKAINEIKPDLIFLDIQMPKLTGFEMLELLDHHTVIVFTTAFDQYAIKAFEMNATDYLLKPFSKVRFGQSVDKARQKLKEKTQSHQIEKLVQSKDQENELIQRVAVRSGKKIHVIPVDEITFIESDGDYVKIHSKDTSFLKEKTMKFFDTHLDPQQFVRIHRSFIVNVNEISRLEQYEKESYIALLKNGAKLKVSKSGYRLVRTVLNL
jgi:two-component system, LytTR family, response regulator